MSRWSRSLVRPLLVVGALLSVVAGSVGPTASPAYAQPPAEHIYSDPVWLPVRTPAQIGCTRTACEVGPGHQFWAIDFTGHRDDPIHPAGAGIAHIGGNSGACSPTSESERGRWVWIDHGAGVVTQYRHLNSITISEGARVTPETMIGRMGGSGSAAPCNGNYLHFEVRHGGNTGPRVDPGELKTCVGGAVTSLPAAYGAVSWDDPVLHPRPRLLTPLGSGTCVGSPWLATPPAPVVSVRRSDRAAAVSWSTPPAGTDAVVVLLETYHPSVKSWGTPVFRTLPNSDTSTLFSALLNGKTYRVSATLHGATGNSTASASREFIPAAAPDAPGKPRYLTWPKKSYVHYGWNRPVANGSVVTSFTAARRCKAGSKPYGGWKTHTQKPADTYINFRGLSSYSTCEVKVRATNALGTGPYSATKTVRR